MQELVQQVVNGLVIGSTYAVVALGFGLIFSVMRVINLAHSEFFMFGAYIAAVVTSSQAPNVGQLSLESRLGVLLLVLLTTILVMIVLGVGLERAIVRPTWGTYHLVPLIATSGIATAMQYGVQRVFGPDALRVPSVLPTTSLSFAGVYVNGLQLATLILSTVIMAGLSYYVYRTRWGLATRAVAERHEVAAAACGVNVNRVAQLTICVSAVIGGVSGIAIGLLYSTASPFMGAMFGTKSFVCMLVAGNRRLEGIMLVGLSLGVMESLITGYITSTYRDAIAYFLLLVVLVFRPSGLFGSYE